MTCISNSVLLVVFGFLLLRSTTPAVTSTVESSAIEINPSTLNYESDAAVEEAQRSTTTSKVSDGDDSIDVELKVANSEPSGNKGRPPGTAGRVPLPPVIEPKATDRLKSLMDTLYGWNPFYGKKDSSFYNNQSMPSIGQYLSQISASGRVIVSKVFTCDDNDDFYLSLTQISDSRKLSDASVTDPGVKRYLNESLYRQKLISHSIRSDVGNPLIEQSATQCSGSVVEGSRIIFDCPAWCGKPISVKQSASQVSSSSLSQIMELYTVCPEGTVPRITYSKKSSQISGGLAQKFKVIALYAVKKL